MMVFHVMTAFLMFYLPMDMGQYSDKMLRVDFKGREAELKITTSAWKHVEINTSKHTLASQTGIAFSCCRVLK